MLSNFFLVAFRNFSRRKGFFLINLLGLAVGLGTFIALYVYTGSEKQFDAFHIKKDRIVRVKAERYHKNTLSREMVDVCYAAGPQIRENFPEAERYVQMVKTISTIRYKEEWHRTEKACYASEDFFKVFSFSLLQGNDSLALARPHTAVVSQSFARKVFGNEDPFGKQINFRGRFTYEITGVFEDMPAISHMNFDIILSFESYKLIVNKIVLEEPWRWDGFVTYLLLRPGSSSTALEKKLPSLINERTGVWLKNSEQQLKLKFQPLTSIHLSSNVQGEWKPNGDGQAILYLQLIAFCIMFLAWINFISLATAKSLERAKEVGVRKSLGGYRTQLIWQFMTEAFLLNLIAFGVAIVLIAGAGYYWPEYSVFENLFILSTGQWEVLALVIVGGSLASGFYPAFVLSRFNPALVLKGSFNKTAEGSRVRRVLVVIQFTCSMVLVIWIYVAGKQLQYLQDRSLGFDTSNKLVVDDSDVYDSLYARNVEGFKKEIVRLGGVTGMSYIETVPGRMITPYANSVRRLRADTSDVNSFSYLRVDEHFTEGLGVKVFAGRFFSETSIRNKEVVVNFSAAKRLGFINPEDAVEEELYFRDDTVRIIGVLHDFYFHSPKTKLLPLIFQYNPRYGYHYVIAFEPDKTKDVIVGAEKLFNVFFPGQPFQYRILEDDYNQQYKADRQFESALLTLSGLSIWITCLGLIGMAAYTTTIRRKEIGIRKVLGSGIWDVLWLLWREYLVLTITSCVLGVPIAWYIIKSWLVNFDSGIILGPMLFVVPVMMLLVITACTVAFQTTKAALANPIDSVRYE